MIFTIDKPIQDYTYLEHVTLKTTLPKEYYVSKNIEIPNLYGKLTTLGSKQDIENFIDDILNDKINISIINGIICVRNESSLFCSYCHVEQLYAEKYYYCLNCDLDMCALCFSEKTEEIAKKNGAKKYYLRKVLLWQCFQNHHLQKRYIKIPRSVDECEKTKFDFCGFGSIFDYVPLLKDLDNNMILLNCNIASPNYNKVVLAGCDNTKKYKFYISNRTLHTILNRLEEICLEEDLGLSPVHFLMDEEHILN
jgi:hypothetical protein